MNLQIKKKLWIRWYSYKHCQIVSNKEISKHDYSYLYATLLGKVFENNHYGQRLCLEEWHINMSNHALNRDDCAYLPEEYMHLIGR
jgi:hypothetical protein